jgi:hypothetical protein
MCAESAADQTIRAWDREFRSTGEATVVDFRTLVNGSVVPERYTHLLHPYPAKLLPQIPYFFLQSGVLTRNRPKSVVADPFCGSGTVLLEAMLGGFEAIGADTNPLARLISRVKTRAISAERVLRALSAVNSSFHKIKQAEPPPVVNLVTWYSNQIATDLARLRSAIKELQSSDLREFMQVCFSSCARKLSRADPRLSVPVRINIARKTQYGPHYRQLKNHLTFLRGADVASVFNETVKRNANRLSSLKPFANSSSIVSILDDVNSPALRETKLADLIITSPPYLGAQKYIRSSSLSLGWLDLAYEGQLRALERRTIGREHFSKAEVGVAAPSGVSDADELLIKIRQQNPLRAHIPLRQYPRRLALRAQTPVPDRGVRVFNDFFTMR